MGPRPTARTSHQRGIVLRAGGLLALLLLLLIGLAGCRGVGDSSKPQPLSLKVKQPDGSSQVSLPKPFKVKKEPSNDRDWLPELKVLPWAELTGDDVTIHNVRNCEFFTYRDCVTDWYDKTYNLKGIKSVDFIVVPFAESPSIAHTMISFGFESGDYVGCSVEVRLERGQAYDTAIGLLGQFELTYVIADERDLIRSRVEHRNCDVYVYRTKATPEQARKLFIDVLKRVNQLKEKPELYDTLSNNCTTNLLRHVEHIAPGSVPYDYRVLLPGFSDQLLYDQKLIDTSLPFEEVKRRARVNEVAIKYRDDPHFSQRIRGERPSAMR
jgi:hypothetical protein